MPPSPLIPWSPFSALGGRGGSQKEQLWDSDYSDGLQSHLFFHQNPNLEDMDTHIPFSSPPGYSCPPLRLVLKREENSIGAAGRIGLNLGKWTYFSSSGDDACRLIFLQKGGGSGVWSPSHQPPRCQAEGCKPDLSCDKHYHRRHKVCDFHSKATVAISHGLQQRFCQQCSKFHVLAEFDEAKRNCRKRSADRSRRRRKPQLIQAAAATTTKLLAHQQSSLSPLSTRLDSSAMLLASSRLHLEV